MLANSVQCRSDATVVSNPAFPLLNVKTARLMGILSVAGDANSVFGQQLQIK